MIDAIDVDPDFEGQVIGSALVSQLLMHLAALRVERVETQVATNDFELLRFFSHCGFGASQTLVVHRRLL